MAVKTVLTVPDPVLRRKARRITAINENVRRLIRDMTETLEQARGVGLAAPQIGASLRLCVFQMPGEEPFALINPSIVKRIGEREVTEGCLSIPGYQGKIKRSVSVTAKGLDLESGPVRLKAAGLLAQALEHEIDHLDGILYIDYLESRDKLFRLSPERRDTEGGAAGYI